MKENLPIFNIHHLAWISAYLNDWQHVAKE